MLVDCSQCFGSLLIFRSTLKVLFLLKLTVTNNTSCSEKSCRERGSQTLFGRTTSTGARNSDSYFPQKTQRDPFGTRTVQYTLLDAHVRVAVTSDSIPATMSYVAKGEKEYDATGAPVPAPKIHKIRITLTSSNVKNLEKCELALVVLISHWVLMETSLRRPRQPREGQTAAR